MSEDALAQRCVAQAGIDDAAVGQQADVTVGQRSHFLATGTQVVRRAPLCDQQRQHLTQRQTARLRIDLVGAAWIEQAIDFTEVGAEPQPQAIGDAMHLTVPGRRRERHAVEVVAHDALTGGQGLRALAIGTHAGGDHLPDLFLRIAGAAFGRMPILLDLGGQGAAAGGLAAEAEALLQLADRRLGEARPVHRRVGVGAAGVQQATVLDEQQAHHHQRWDVLEALVILAWIAVGVDRNAAAVVDGQPGLGILGVGWKESAVGVIQQCPREACLLLDPEVAL